MDSLMSFMQDHIDGNDWTPHELATHSAKLAGMLAEMQNREFLLHRTPDLQKPRNVKLIISLYFFRL